jgi:hypothetical protein
VSFYILIAAQSMRWIAPKSGGRTKSEHRRAAERRIVRASGREHPRVDCGGARMAEQVDDAAIERWAWWGCFHRVDGACFKIKNKEKPLLPHRSLALGCR